MSQDSEILGKENAFEVPRNRIVRRVDELHIYQRAFAAAASVYEASRSWPREERFALTSQVLACSRSVCANVSEAWRKRRYPRHFVSKLSDADAEAGESQTWLAIAHECGYLDDKAFQLLFGEYDTIMAGLVRMMRNPEAWCGPARLRE